jgi:hypothetical protein
MTKYSDIRFTHVMDCCKIHVSAGKQKQNHINDMRTFKTKFRENKTLLNITTGNGTCVYRYDPEESSQWKSPSSLCPRWPYKFDPV